MKGQMKIQQTAFMLVAITLFFVLVGMFILVFKFSDLKQTATELEEKNAMLLVSKLANSPEFSCGGAFGGEKISCIDADKVLILKEGVEKYQGFWGVSNIEIKKIYPVEQDVSCNIANYPDCNVISLRSGSVTGFDASNFVSLCRKEVKETQVYDKCELAKILVSYEKK